MAWPVPSLCSPVGTSVEELRVLSEGPRKVQGEQGAP